jgi:hypothetical protein
MFQVNRAWILETGVPKSTERRVNEIIAKKTTKNRGQMIQKYFYSNETWKRISQGNQKEIYKGIEGRYGKQKKYGKVKEKFDPADLLTKSSGIFRGLQILRC